MSLPNGEKKGEKASRGRFNRFFLTCPFQVPSGLPRNLEAAIQRYGSASFKAPVATVLDPNGKLITSLTYGKLLSRSQKIAYTLLSRSFSKDVSLKSGDRIALVYPNNDPINFLCAFYGCLQAGIVPVPIEVPLTRRVSNCVGPRSVPALSRANGTSVR